MACPTCDATMARVCTEANTVEHYHCERCGTHSAVYKGGHRNDYVPKLVQHCREFFVPVILEDSWRRSGIAESINLPGERTL